VDQLDSTPPLYQLKKNKNKKNYRQTATTKPRMTTLLGGGEGDFCLPPQIKKKTMENIPNIESILKILLF
jgi:hypothetical protein